MHWNDIVINWANELKCLSDIGPEQELNKQELLLKLYFANHLSYKIQHISTRPHLFSLGSVSCDYEKR